MSRCQWVLQVGTRTGLDSVSLRLGPGLDLLSAPQSLGLVLVSMHSGPGLDLV